MHFIAAVSFVLLAGPAHASQTVSGRWIVASYDDDGVWNNSEVHAGLTCDFDEDGEQTEITWRGQRYAAFALAFTHHGEEMSFYGGDDYATVTVLSEEDLSTADQAWAAYEYVAGPLAIGKDEIWGVDDHTMLVVWTLTNDSDFEVEDLRVALMMDPDQDYDPTDSWSFDTNNDVQDLDGDGVEDWAQSVGRTSGDTVGFGACDPRNTEVGHHWDNDAGTDVDRINVYDKDGASADSAMVWRWEAPTPLEAGGTITTSLVVAMGDTEEEAQEEWLAAMEDCVVLGLELDAGDPEKTHLWSGCDGSPYDCAHSAGRPAAAWWAVALGAVAALRRRSVLRRERCAAPPPRARSRPARPAAPA